MGDLTAHLEELAARVGSQDLLTDPAPVIDSRHRNAMVRGRPVTHARVEAGMIELPPDFSAGYSGIYSLQTGGKM